LFASVGPAIQGVTDGIIGLAQGAMPGLVAAVESGQPVFDGLKNFLTSIGTGLGDMFQTLSEHSAAFGQVFTSLGDVVRTLLPALGDLLSAGGELAATILPPLAAGLRVVGDVLHAIAPILPEIAIGFAAFKVVSTVSPMLDTFAQKLAFASYSSGPLAGAAGAASSAVSSLGSALPLVGIAVAGIGAVMASTKQEIDSWTQALIKG
jgi:phage-related protein